MEILAHRGAWHQQGRKNSIEALGAALKSGYGIETDVRDHKGQLVIAHDVPGPDSVSFVEFLDLYLKGQYQSPMAINIKSDGLTDRMTTCLEKVPPEQYFVFDMSIPDTLPYLKANLPVFIRVSELESSTPLLTEAQGIWLDELTRSWITETSLNELAEHDKPVCIVSAELHSRDQVPQWQMLKGFLENSSAGNRWLLCTDYPDKAQEYFSID